jgi:Ca-activated chloride channel homolog
VKAAKLIKKMIAIVLPPKRGAFSWVQILPLLIFLGCFAGVVYGLEYYDVLQFARPAAFGLIAITVWFWWTHLTGFNGLTRGRALTALWIRLCVVGVFVMLMAEPRSVRTTDIISVVYTVDVSDSIGDSKVDEALAFITEQVYEKPAEDEAGMVVFGGSAAVELSPNKTFVFEGVVASQVQRDATNIDQALSLSAAMLPEEHSGRIVLIGDGTSTAGNLSKTLDMLKSRGIKVDVLPIDYEYKDEVWVERLEIPQNVKVGQDYDATIIVGSLKAGGGELIFKRNDKTIVSKQIKFDEGKTRYTIPLTVERAGYFEFDATINVPKSTGRDHLKQNNSVKNYLYVEGEGKVLVVTDPLGNENDWEELVKSINLTDRVVEVIDANAFPQSDTPLMEYDCIVWVNVPKDAFNQAQIQALHDSVYNLGTGFLMVGGPDSFGSGGYHKSLVEKTLPVSMDVSQKKMLPKGALVIVLHTCEFADGNTWGKRITKEAIRVLSPRDDVGVITYSYAQNRRGDSWLFKLTPAGRQAELFPKIENAQIGDMPSFVTSMKMGLDELVASDAAAKQMIIISDGDPTPPPQATLDAFVKAKIKISTIAIFPHGGNDISNMKFVAELTGGNYYNQPDPNRLPSIFIKEARTLKRNMVQERTFVPELGSSSPIMKGVTTVQPLHGYVLTSLKPKAQAVLLTPPEKNEKGEPQPPDPILAKWRYGLGSTAAFTSDISNRWGKDWIGGWDKFQPVVKQLLAEISKVRVQGELRLWTYTSGSDGVFVIEDYAKDESFLEIAAKLRGPNKEIKDVSFRQISSRRYQARVPLWGQGRYQLIAKGVGDGRTDTTVGGFIVPYSPEYLRFRANPIVLEEIAEKTGGRILDVTTPSKAIFGERDPKQSSAPVYDYFMLIIACLIPLDVAVRRIQIDLFAIRQLFKSKEKKKAPSSSTMGALLQRKQDVDEKIDAQRDEPQRFPNRPAFPVPQGKRSARPASDTNKPKPKTPDKQPQASGTTETMSKLLAIKRRRQEEEG